MEIDNEPRPAHDGIDSFIRLLTAELYLRDTEGRQLTQIDNAPRFARQIAEKVIDILKARRGLKMILS